MKQEIKLNEIYAGNCFDFFPAMAENSVDFVFTSPPYNRKRNDKYMFYDDQLTDYKGFLTNLIDESMRVARKWAFINMQTNYYNSSDVYEIIGKYHKDIRQVIIWGKTNPMPANGFNLTNSYEVFLVLDGGAGPLRANKTYTKNLIMTGVNTKMPKEHKAVMRQDVADWFIETFTQEGETVLDPCIGVGTTAISCKTHGRNYIGFELVEEYCEIARERIEAIA